MSTGINPRHLGKYELRVLLGQGRVTEVWKAFDTNLHRYVAIKLLHADLHATPDFIVRFEREARLIASLHHSNIVQIHDFQVLPLESTNPSDTPVAYMVMDYVEGTTLAEYIRGTSYIKRFPSAADIVHLFASISSAIDYAHQHGMIHRDIKPDNILLDKRGLKNVPDSQNPIGEPVLTDFGIAKLLGTSSALLSGAWLGTPYYISPEQAQGQLGTERSDIYSLGVILYEICTGQLPFQGDTPPAIMMHHVNSNPPAPERINPNISPALQDVILRSLAKNPSARFPSASSMTIALAEAFNLPVPERLNTGISQPHTEVSSTPTIASPIEGMQSPATIKPTLSLLMTPPSTTPLVSNQQNLFMTPPATTPSTTPIAPILQNTPILSPSGAASQQTPTFSPPPSTLILPPQPLPSSQRRRRGRLIALIAVLLIVLAGSGLGALYLLTLPPTTSTIVGHAFFVSSGQLSESSSQGINDQMQIDLSNIAPPAAGKSYYAWLLGDKHPTAGSGCGTSSTATSIFLGILTVNQNAVHYRYPGNAQHTNLISCTSRFLVTEEDANSTPLHPSSNQSTWRYYAEIPQIPNPKILTHFSALDDIRHLLYEGPDLQQKGIHGGLDIRLLRNTEKIWEWASSARNAWAGSSTTMDTLAFIHRQVARILYYLDGATLVKPDVPPGTPLGLALGVDPKLAQVPLLASTSSYLSRISRQLSEIHIAPGTTLGIRNLAAQINTDLISNVKVWLQNVYKDVKKLVLLTDTQLEQSSTFSLLVDLQTQTTNVLLGQINPSTNKVQAGVVQIHDNIQQLTTFNIQPYASH